MNDLKSMGLESDNMDTFVIKVEIKSYKRVLGQMKKVLEETRGLRVGGICIPKIAYSLKK